MSTALDQARPQVSGLAEQFTLYPAYASRTCLMNDRAFLFRSFGDGPRTALHRDGRVASAFAEGRAPLNRRAHL